MEQQNKGGQNHFNWILFFLFALFISRKDRKKLSLNQIDLLDIDKKTKLLNRIKGYMDLEEQYILHRAEIILQIIGNVKMLMESPEAAGASVRYTSLSLEDRKRNMLMDLSEFLEEDQRELVHQAIDFDMKIKTIDRKLKEVHNLSESGNIIVNIPLYIDALEPLLVEGLKEKAVEIKKLTSMLRAIVLLQGKEKIDEADIVEIARPFVQKEQMDSLTKIVQIFKVISSMNVENDENNELTPSENLQLDHSPEKILKKEGEIIQHKEENNLNKY